MKTKWPVWIILLIVAIGLVYIWLILFRSSFTSRLGQRDADELWSKSSWLVPVAQTSPGFAAAPDAVTGATPRIMAMQTRTIVEKLRPLVVGISVGNTGQPPNWQAGLPAGRQGWKILTPSGRWSVGSGVIVHPQGYIITNNHVVAPTGQIVVSVFSGSGYKEYPAQLINKDPSHDLALIKINANQPFPSIPFGDSGQVRVGDQVIAIGNPFGLAQTVTKGIISAKRNKIMIGNNAMYNLLQTDVPINPGNSGGILCNLKGEVIGINVAIYSPVESIFTGISFAIPINQAKVLYGNYMDMTTRLVNYQWVASRPSNYWWPSATGGGTQAQANVANPVRIPKNQRIMPSPGEGIEEIAWLGIDLVPDPLGVEADEIEGISPMEAGLEAGDIIKKVNGVPTPDMYAMKEVIKTIPIKEGQGIVLDVYRRRINRNIFISFRLKEWDIKGR